MLAGRGGAITVLAGAVLAVIATGVAVARARRARRFRRDDPRMSGVRVRDVDEPWYADIDGTGRLDAERGHDPGA